MTRFVVQGRVQGVGFRWFVQREAEQIGVAGFARNLPDGTVEVVATGTEEQLALLESALNRGPPFARVESVEKSHISHQLDGFKSFEIR